MVRQREDFTRKVFKLMCVILHNESGFGKKRLLDTIGNISELIKQSDTDEVFWEHIDKLIIDQLGLPFDRDYSDWK